MKDPKGSNFIEPSFQLNIVLSEPGSNDLMRSLHARLHAAIREGRLAPGVRLPPTRTLASSLGVSRNTVCAAYNLLLGEGYITTFSGAAGTRVAATLPPSERKVLKDRAADSLSVANRRLQPLWRARPSDALALALDRPKYDFRLGIPDLRRVPFDIWNRLSTRTLRQLSRLPAEYGPAQGSHALCETIAGYASVTRAVACEPADVLITAGAQQAFDLLARVLVTPGRTVVAVENPGYPPLRDIFASHGAILAAVPVDEEGIIVDRLPKTARVIYVTPSHQFPTGVVMSARRRLALLAFAAKHDACIIEDDYDSEFRFGGRPLDALQTLDREGLVFYVGTFSKSLLPALRMGFVVMPGWASAALIQAKRLADWHAPLHMQETLAAFIAEGHFGRHVRKMHRIYSQRRQTVLDALAHYCGDTLVATGSIAGLHLGVRYQSHGKIQQLLAEAASHGLGLETFSRYDLTYSAQEGLALGYGAIDVQQIEEGIRLLGQALGKQLVR